MERHEQDPVSAMSWGGQDTLEAQAHAADAFAPGGSPLDWLPAGRDGAGGLCSMALASARRPVCGSFNAAFTFRSCSMQLSVNNTQMGVITITAGQSWDRQLLRWHVGTPETPKGVRQV
jgi:hypothetical protein